MGRVGQQVVGGAIGAGRGSKMFSNFFARNAIFSKFWLKIRKNIDNFRRFFRKDCYFRLKLPHMGVDALPNPFFEMGFPNLPFWGLNSPYAPPRLVPMYGHICTVNKIPSKSSASLYKYIVTGGQTASL